MPNFLLQPVVENAIKHGIDYIEDGSTGKVIIEYQKRLDALVFNIYNNGPLIPSGEMDHLINKQGKGYGIRNIAERLELYYGNDHKFGVAVMDEIYTCFTIRIPDQLKTDDNHSE